MPNTGFLPQTSHTEAIENAPFCRRTEPGEVSTPIRSTSMLTSLSAADLRQAVLRFRDALRAHQDELNRLNVYPVPDGDTGTNMALTLESVVDELPADGAAMGEVCEAIR